MAGWTRPDRRTAEGSIDPRIAALTALQIVFAVAVGWVVGDALVATACARRPELLDRIGLPERALAAICGLVAASAALMVVHIATGGAVFGSSWVVPLCAVAMIGLGIRRRAWPTNVPWRAVVLGVLVLSAFFVLPVLRGGTGVRTGDTPWHLGWSEQLLDGEPVPTGPAPEYGRNAYPWGFHAVVATLVRLVPGSDPRTAHEALHVLLVMAIPLGAACIARCMNRTAGWGAAAAAALIGGFGWLSAEEPYFILSPSLARYGADLVVASPNSMYELFPPALPRELGLVILAAGGVAISLAATSPGRRERLSAGVLVGLAGLISVPIFVMGLVWIVFGAFAMPRTNRAFSAATMLASALAVFSLWVAPVIANYIRFGGFVDITPRLGVEWPLGTALWSWGILVPVSCAGILIAARNRKPSTMAVLWLLYGSLVLLGVAIARGELSWDLGGNETLLHQGRVWPVVHLLAAAFAGLALMVIYKWLALKSRLAAAVAVAGLFSVAAASPAIASVHLTRVIATDDAGYLYARPDFNDDAFVPTVAHRLHSTDVIEVEGSNFLGFLLFSFSGARLASYDDARLANNDLRIRYEALARRWDERIAGEGFDPDYKIMPASHAPDDVEPIVTGMFREEEWVLLPAD
jgi:hypothetical protein